MNTHFWYKFSLFLMVLSIIPTTGWAQLNNSSEVSENDIVSDFDPVPDYEEVPVDKSFHNRLLENFHQKGFSINSSLTYYAYPIDSNQNLKIQNSWIIPFNFSLPEQPITSSQAMLANWNGGTIIANGEIRRLPGLMQIENASVGIYQTAGNFSFYAGALANKYGYFRGLHTQYGIEGSISYQISPRLSFLAFGTYFIGNAPTVGNGLPMSPAMAGYYAQSKFGGTFDYQINDHWGVEAGMQTVQQVGLRKYEVEPIVTPYYKVGKVKIGLPVGQILYELLRK